MTVSNRELSGRYLRPAVAPPTEQRYPRYEDVVEKSVRQPWVGPIPLEHLVLTADGRLGVHDPRDGLVRVPVFDPQADPLPRAA